MRFILLLLFSTLSLFSQLITEDLEYQKISSVGYDWSHVNLGNSYSDAVVVCSSVLPSQSYNEVVVRVDNVSSSGFDVKIQRPNNEDPGYSTDVYCIISDEGSYTIPVKYEAHKVVSDSTNGYNSPNDWSASRAEDVSSNIVHTYTKPAVLGQVMTYNDSDFSVFWSFDCDSKGNRPFQDGMEDGICVGKHVGQISQERATETLGYIVAEAGVYELKDFSMAINYGADSIKGVGDEPEYTYTLDKAYTEGVVTKEAEDGGQGGWAVLYGDAPFGTSLDLAIDEETVEGDTTRTHITENVAYWVFLYDPITSSEMKINEVLYQQTVTGSSNDEFVEFFVTQSGDLKNYLFADQDGTSHHYRFPKHTVTKGDYVILHIGEGSDEVIGNVHHFYKNSDEFLNDTGDDVLLLKPINNDITIIDGLSVNALPFDYVAYETESNVDPIPTSENGVTLSWDFSYATELDDADDGCSISLSPNGVDSDSSACWEFTASGNASDNGCTGYLITRDTNSDATLTYSLGEVNTALPDIKLSKSSLTLYDPINIENNPKAIPGALVEYTIHAQNEGLGQTDKDTVVLADSVPDNMKLCVDNVDKCLKGIFIDGSISSELSLASIAYSDNGGSDFNYTPTADAEGYDSTVTNIQFKLDGAFKESDGTNYPSFDIKFYMGVK
jgi:hypothetical protein